ncbi:MAG: nucleotidyl transferase AbiEii/AbiGii toxin family protein [Bacteroidales bacterium]|nr:nucleotidyl transferase AbiEii/AbiGii toxin family protein [Bacteroidales bacterium]
MLQKETIKDNTLELLKKLQREETLSTTRLVGGTALALQIGHRISVDLDLFSKDPLDINAIEQILTHKFNFSAHFISKGSVRGEIDGIKIDILHHPYEWIDEPVCEEDIIMASLQDITAMKLNSIIHNGTRPKDFLDVAYLSQYFSYDNMRSLLVQKYPEYDPILLDRCINYFDDIETDFVADIRLVDGRVNFNKVKQRLIQMTDNPFDKFDNPPSRSREI